MKLVVNQAYENMGLASTQTLGPILDGLMRNTPDAERFIELAEREGVRRRGRRARRPVRRLQPGPPRTQPDPGTSSSLEQSAWVARRGRSADRTANPNMKKNQNSNTTTAPITTKYEDALGCGHARSLARVHRALAAHAAQPRRVRPQVGRLSARSCCRPPASPRSAGPG